MNLFNLHKDLTDHPDKELIPIVVWEKYQHIPDELKKREKILARDPEIAYYYAKSVLKGPFPLGEPVIAESAEYSYSYTRDVLKGPFPMGEPVIAKDGESAFNYAYNIISDRWPIGEPAIAKDAECVL